LVDQENVRRIALALPGVFEEQDRFAFSVLNRGKSVGVCWVWLERIHPKKARVPNPAVLAFRVADLWRKEILLESDRDLFFTEPHYAGYPAVMLRLERVDDARLEELIREGYEAALAPPKRSQGRARSVKTAEG
jgi:hypothetical protein